MMKYISIKVCEVQLARFSNDRLSECPDKILHLPFKDKTIGCNYEYVDKVSYSTNFYEMATCKVLV